MNISAGIMLLLLVANAFALTEQDVIRQVLNNHTLFQNVEIDMFSAQERLKSKYKDYYGWDIKLTAKASAEELSAKKDSPKSYTSEQIKYKREALLNFSTAFEGGTSLSIKFSRKMPIDKQEKYKNLDYDKSIQLSEYDNALEVGVNIPLLRDSDGGKNQLSYNKAELDNEIEKFDLLEDKEDEVAEALEAFIEIALDLDKLKVYQNYIALLSEFLQTITDKKNRKSVSFTIKKMTIEMNKVQASLDSAILQLQSSIGFRRSNLSNINFNHKIRLTPVSNIKRHLLKHNRDLLTAQLDIDKKDKEIERYKNIGKPELDFSLWGKISKDKGNYSSYSYYNKESKGANLEFSYPLGGDASNNYNLLDAKLSRRKKSLDYENELNKKILDVQVLVSEIKALNSDVNNYEKQLKQQLSSAELLTSVQGVKNIRFILYDFDEYYQRQLDYVDTLVDYHQKRIQYDNLLDRLVTKDDCYLCGNYDSLIPQ
ncbi:MAG: TolC family protein [Gammaproteobacteria bacterium]|nr:TolC family protein [Gammaproteobacteria bacterium]